MRSVVSALCFALGFAIPAWVGAVAYPFHAMSAYPDGGLGFHQFCLYALVAGIFAGAVYATAVARHHCDFSIARSLLSGFFTLIGTFLGAFLLALPYDNAPAWLRGFVLVGSLTVCAFVCALLLNGGDPVSRFKGGKP